jgi:hypothetical protein
VGSAHPTFNFVQSPMYKDFKMCFLGVTANPYIHLNPYL